jgi:hypothetical protein
MRAPLVQLTKVSGRAASRPPEADLMTFALPVYAPVDILPGLARKTIVNAGSRLIIGA